MCSPLVHIHDQYLLKHQLQLTKIKLNYTPQHISFDSLAQLPYFLRFKRDMPHGARKNARKVFRRDSKSPMNILSRNAVPTNAAMLRTKEKRSQKSMSTAWFARSMTTSARGGKLRTGRTRSSEQVCV